MKLRVVVLGAGFGGLELSTILSEALGDGLDLTLLGSLFLELPAWSFVLVDLKQNLR